MRRPALVALAVALGVAAYVPGVASAQEPQCTLVVTEDTVLDRDIECLESGAAAVEIGTANITLDLGGHTVSGDYGVRNRGHDNVTIKNGTAVGDDGEAVSIEHAERNTVTAMRTENGTRYGILLTDSNHARIVSNPHASGYRGAIALQEGSDRNLVYGNTVSGYTGIAIHDGSRNGILANKVATGETQSIVVGSGAGNAIAFNTASSGDDVIRVGEAATGTLLLANRATGSDWGDGITVGSRSTVLIANTANDNADYGIEAVPGVFGVGNRASGNGNPAQCLNVRCR